MKKGKKLTIARQCEMHYHEGTFGNIIDLYKWLGKITTASAGHIFEIDVKIVELKEEEK